eukprot:359469-Chlamydomonas_euryale.AAC.4
MCRRGAPLCMCNGIGVLDSLSIPIKPGTTTLPLLTEPESSEPEPDAAPPHPNHKTLLHFQQPHPLRLHAHLQWGAHQKLLAHLQLEMCAPDVQYEVLRHCRMHNEALEEAAGRLQLPAKHKPS